jgi:hypothetical protein
MFYIQFKLYGATSLTKPSFDVNVVSKPKSSQDRHHIDVDTESDFFK